MARSSNAIIFNESLYYVKSALTIKLFARRCKDTRSVIYIIPLLNETVFALNYFPQYSLLRPVERCPVRADRSSGAHRSHPGRRSVDPDTPEVHVGHHTGEDSRQGDHHHAQAEVST